MNLSWKRIAGALAIVAGGTGLFFLSTFSFLAAKGQLNMQTLARIPGIGRLFEREADRPSLADMAMLAKRMSMVERSLNRLESRLAQSQAGESISERVTREENGTVLFEVDPILVNLHGSNGKRSLTGQFFLGIETKEGEDDESFRTLRNAQSRAAIRDAMIRIFRKKSVDDIEGDLELDGLRKEIAQAVQDAVFAKGSGKVKNVYVNEFVIR